MTKEFWANLKYDVPAGIVVFLIALPLCLGIALASGAPLLAGLISGIIGGIVIAALSGSPFSVSGPAAGLIAVVLTAIADLGSFNVFVLAVLIAGVFQLILGFAKAGSITAYFPSNVIKGMLTAIGIIIIMKQIPYALGAHGDAEGNLSFIEADGSNTVLSFLKSLLHIHPGAVIVTLVSFAIIMLWERPFMRKAAVVPGPLVAVIVAVIINEVFVSVGAGASFELSNDKLVTLPEFKGFASVVNSLNFPDFTQIVNPKVWIVAATIAAVASIETLLNLEAVDTLDPLRRTTSPNRELKAQGVGNILAGLIGGLPITSVIVRSSANVNAGARSKFSAIIHGVLLLVCTFTIPFLLNKIPLSSLAAILLLTGYKLAKISVFKEMFRKGKYQWAPFVITVLAIVFTNNLLTGILIGLGASIFALLHGNMKMSYYFHREKHVEGEVVHMELAQEVSFLNRASIKQTLDHMPPKSVVWIDASNTSYIDHDVLELIRSFKDVQAPAKNIELHLTGFREEYHIENSRLVVSEKLLDVKNKLEKNKAEASQTGVTA